MLSSAWRMSVSDTDTNCNVLIVGIRCDCYGAHRYMRYMVKEQRQYAPNRIKEIRLERNLNQEDVAALTGDVITKATVSKLEKGQMGLTLDYMNLLGEALQVPPESFITNHISGRTLPVLARIAAGNWREAISDPTGWRSIPADVKTGPNSFVLLPEGDSMDLIVDEDGFIVVDPDQKDMFDGQLYALQTEDGDATFKKFFTNPPRLEPCSSNPVHQVMPLGREPIITIGRVTFARRF